jgi:acyl carrier protein
MATDRARVVQYVLDYFHRKWPSATEATSLGKDLGLDAYDIYDIGRDLRGWRGANYTPDEFGACKKIKNVVDLIYKKVIAAGN